MVLGEIAMFLLGGVGMGGSGGSPEVGEMGGGGMDGFCWVLLSRMGRLGFRTGRLQAASMPHAD